MAQISTGVFILVTSFIYDAQYPPPQSHSLQGSDGPFWITNEGRQNGYRQNGGNNNRWESNNGWNNNKWGNNNGRGRKTTKRRGNYWNNNSGNGRYWTTDEPSTVDPRGGDWIWGGVETDTTIQPSVTQPTTTMVTEVTSTMAPEVTSTMAPEVTSIPVTMPEDCGRPLLTNMGKKIIGGVVSTQHQWPWMASLYEDGDGSAIRFICGASIINRLYLLTAAHCLEEGNSHTVRLGDNNITATRADGDPAYYTVTNYLKHPGYQTPASYNDIALLQVERNIVFTQYVRPICFPASATGSLDLTNVSVTLAGWGTTQYGGKISQLLLHVVVEIVSRSQCEAAYKQLQDYSLAFPQGIPANIMLCAGVLQGGKDACQGDSGGPMMWQTGSGRWEILGIVSTGYKCAVKGFYGLYTRTSGYLDWITENAVGIQ